MDRNIAQYRLCLNAESYIKNIMHFLDRECVRTLRPLFVYATEQINESTKFLLGSVADRT